MKKGFEMLLIMMVLSIGFFVNLSFGESLTPPGDSIIQLVTIPETEIDNTSEKKCEIRFFLRKPAKVTCVLLDAYDNKIRSLVKDHKYERGTVSLMWDGKNNKGELVPVGAYIPIINVVSNDSKLHTYDPRKTTGWKPIATSKPSYDKEKDIVSFRTEKPAYVRIRIGHQNGPMYMTLLDWESLMGKEHQIPWSGLDATEKIDLSTKPLNFICQAMSFPENTLYVTKSPTKSRKSDVPKSFTLKPIENEVVLDDYARQIAMNSLLYQRSKGASPRFKVELPKAQDNKDGIPVVSGQTPLKIIIDERDVGWLADEHFEMLMFIDDEYYTEEEEGYSPITWPWDTTELEDGLHLVTIMIQSFKDRIGTHSLQIWVQNDKDTDKVEKEMVKN